MNKIIFVISAAAALAACKPQQDPRLVLTMTPDQVDRACIISAGNDLRRALHVEATAGRAFPPPAGRDTVSERLVELDAQSAGVPVTYVYACGANGMGAFVSVMGRK